MRTTWLESPVGHVEKGHYCYWILQHCDQPGLESLDRLAMKEDSMTGGHRHRTNILLYPWAASSLKPL